MRFIPAVFLNDSDAEGFSFLDDPPAPRPIPAVNEKEEFSGREGSSDRIVDPPITRPFYCTLEDL